jgi:MoaA/NifB/PqqE/SkfB family radical SAM enzyme
MVSAKKTPKVIDVEAIPKRSGRIVTEIAPLVPAIRDGKPHAIEDLRSEEDRVLWRRRLRRVAKREGMKVETRYRPEEARLYFQGSKDENDSR